MRKLNLIRFSAQPNDLNLSENNGTSDTSIKRKGNHYTEGYVVFPEGVELRLITFHERKRPDKHGIGGRQPNKRFGLEGVDVEISQPKSRQEPQSETRRTTVIPGSETSKVERRA